MFYRESEQTESAALVVLTPSESKRLIARAIKELPEVKAALKDGTVVAEGPKEALLKDSGTTSLEDFFFELLKG